jgi:hypothetical protein
MSMIKTDKQILQDKIFYEYKAGTPIKEIRSKYNLDSSQLSRIFSELVDQYKFQFRNIMRSRMTPEARKNYNMWVSLNSYQGEDQAVRFPSV